jgi:fructosamine-3-kinase
MTPAEFGTPDRTATDAEQTGIDAKPAEPGTDWAVSGSDPTGPDAEQPEIEADWPAGLPRPRHEEALPGGYIGRTSRAVLADGRTVLIKRCPYPAAQEADGLRALAAAGAPAPGILGVGDRTLVLEWLQGEPDWPALGRAVARMHRHTADRFGWPVDNYAGRFPQDNTWTDDWPTFYVRHRVLPQLNRAEVPPEVRHRIEHACAGPLPVLLRPDPPASLTHGDLWPGNMIDGRWLVDPAVSYADRELDLAYLSLSDDLPPEFMTAYLAEYPVDPGFDERRPALLLHKHLVNVRHFGERILPRLTALLDTYGW